MLDPFTAQTPPPVGKVQPSPWDTMPDAEIKKMVLAACAATGRILTGPRLPGERVMTDAEVAGRVREQWRDDPNRPRLTLADEAPTPRRTWQRVDIEPVLTGTYAPPLPTVGARSDGAGLFYPGRLHTIASEAEGGKTWLALSAARHELDAGHAVIYLDFEDDEGGIVGRLLALGADPRRIRDRFAYIRPEQSVEALGNRQDLAAVFADLTPSLVILDGVTEAMTLHGLEMKDNTDIAKFGQMLPRWIADRGPACVALDHVVKDRENRGRYAIGGVHKLNGVNGAAYLLENRALFSIGREGRSTVYVAKDRPGEIRRHCLPSSGGRHWYADLVVTSHDERVVEVALTTPDPLANGEEGTFRPTILMEKVAKLLSEKGPLPKQVIESLVYGKGTNIRLAVDLLIADGFVTPNRPHGLLKPYPPEAVQ